MRGMSTKRAAAATVGLALIGMAISVVLGVVHSNLAASSGYTSFCNVNESVNCDVVLSSGYAYFAGLPVAWWAILTYLCVAAGATVAVRARRATRRRQAAMALFVVALWSLLYSLFLAVVALAVLDAVCMLCGGLYLVNAGLFVSTWLLLTGVRAEGRASARRMDAWQGRTRLIAGAAAMAVVAFLVGAGWEASGGGKPLLSTEDVAAHDPDFYRWYTALPVKSVNLAGGHAKGDPGSVVIVEFSDFECGHCAEAYRNLKTVLSRYGKDVQLVFQHFPLNADCNPTVRESFHSYACEAAMAAECAATQGHFWEYHDLLFENQSALDRDSLIEYAESLGLDRSQFLACLESDAARRAVERDVSEGDQLGVASTPTFFFNGRMLKGSLDTNKLDLAVRLERAARQSGS